MKETFKRSDTLFNASWQTTALYPEFSRGTTALMQEFITRAVIANKQIKLSRYGSPYHGDLLWKVDRTPIRTYSDVLSGKTESEFTLLEFVVRNLQADTAALFSQKDFGEAIEMGVFPGLTIESQNQIQTFLSYNASNGILLVPMAQS